MKNVKQIFAAGASVAALGVALLVHAAPSPQSVNVNVSATVLGSCNLTKNSDLLFGNVDVSGTTVTAAASLTLQCNRGAVPSLTVGVSANAGSCTTTSRCMAQAGFFLDYDIYIPSAAGTNWTSCPAVGTGTVWNTTNTLDASSSFSAAGGNSTISVCGELPLPQLNVPANLSAYTDTVTVTAFF